MLLFLLLLKPDRLEHLFWYFIDSVFLNDLNKVQGGLKGSPQTDANQDKAGVYRKMQAYGEYDGAFAAHNYCFKVSSKTVNSFSR